MIQVVSTLTPAVVWQCSRNGEDGSGRMMKQPISSISAVAAGPVAGQASTWPGWDGTIWPTIESGPISSSMVSSDPANDRNRGPASSARTAGAAAGWAAESNVSAASSASTLCQVYAALPASVNAGRHGPCGADGLAQRGHQAVIIGPLLARHWDHLRRGIRC